MRICSVQAGGNRRQLPGRGDPICEILRDLEDIQLSGDLRPEDILDLPASVKRFMRWILEERAVTCERAAFVLNVTEEDVRLLFCELSAGGLIEHIPTCGVPMFRACLTPRRLYPPRELLERLAE